LTGVPVAATPGLVPHCEVLVAALALEVAAGLLGAVPCVAGEPLVLLLHAAMPIAMTATAAAASRDRRRGCLFMSSAFARV